MRVWICLALIVASLFMRGAVFGNHDDPRGDVLLDVGVARSLLDGEGFAAGFTRGTAFVVGDGEVPPQDMADQHAPLWPLIGAGFAWLFGTDPFTGLKLASLVAGVALLLATWRLIDRLTESAVGAPDGLAAFGAALVALSFVAIDATGNGSLYAAQALGVVLLVDHLGSPRPSGLCLGLLLGGLWALNHQCLVLLPVPLVVLALTSRARATGGAVVAGVVAIAIAALVQAPWWWRNVELFGSPTYSVNPLYLLHRLGVVPEIAVEAGGPVARFPADVPWVSLMVGGVKGWLPSNVLYVFMAGLSAWPATMGLAVAAAVPTLRRGCRTGDRRAVALVVTLAVLVAVSVVWPATKLRYLVPLTPLVVALGVTGLAHAGSRAWRLVAMGVWVALLLLTMDDLSKPVDLFSGLTSHRTRWMRLAITGAIVYVLPLLLLDFTARKREVVASVKLAPWLAIGLLFAGLESAAAVFDTAPFPLDPKGNEIAQPGTAYFSTASTPDYFGQHKEVYDEADARMLSELWTQLAAAGAQRVIAPVGMLAHPVPQLVRVPMVTTTEDAPDAALFDAAIGHWLDDGVEHVVVPDTAPRPSDPRLERAGATFAGVGHGFTWYRVTR